jgi:hypothetical protein
VKYLLCVHIEKLLKVLDAQARRGSGASASRRGGRPRRWTWQEYVCVGRIDITFKVKG